MSLQRTPTSGADGRPLDRAPIVVREYLGFSPDEVLDKADKDALTLENTGYVVGMASWTVPDVTSDPLRLTVTFRYDEIAAGGGGGGGGIWRRLKGGEEKSRGRGKGGGGGISVSASKADGSGGGGPSSPLTIYALRCGGLAFFMGFMFFIFFIVLGAQYGLESPIKI